MSVCEKFEGCDSKTVGGVGFLRVTGFSKKPHGCQFDGTDMSRNDL